MVNFKEIWTLMVLVIAFLLLVSLVVNTALAALVDFLGEFLPVWVISGNSLAS
jgi:hypothetical protein